MSNPPHIQVLALPDDIEQETALKLMVDSMTQGSLDEHNELILDAVLMREETSSTYLEDGLAVPHGRLPVLEDMNIVVGISPRGIQWPHEKQTAHLIVLLGVPSKMVTAYLTTMQKLLRWYKAQITHSAKPHELTTDQLKDQLISVLN